jgi:hypothetical protein
LVGIKKWTFISKLIIKYNKDKGNMLTWHTYPQGEAVEFFRLILTVLPLEAPH